MGASAHCRGNGPKARIGAEPHDLFNHNVKAICVAVIMGRGSWRWLSQLLRGEAQAPEARGVHGLHRHVEYPTVADAVIETA